VGAGVFVGVSVGVAVGVGVAVSVGRGVGVGLAVAAQVAVGEGTSVGVTVGVGGGPASHLASNQPLNNTQIPQQLRSSFTGLCSTFAHMVPRSCRDVPLPASHAEHCEPQCRRLLLRLYTSTRHPAIPPDV
jgi:hypothetical protein